MSGSGKGVCAREEIGHLFDLIIFNRDFRGQFL